MPSPPSLMPPMRLPRRVGAMLLVLLAAGGVEAQSLAELSRQIRAERAQRAAGGELPPDRPPDLTKNVLTNADLYVYTTEPRPVRYERFVVHTPAPAPRRAPGEPPPPNSIREWNDTLDALRNRSIGGVPWGLYGHFPATYGPIGLPHGKTRGRRGNRADRPANLPPFAPAPQPVPYVPPETVMSPRVQGCWSGGGAWANGRCVS